MRRAKIEAREALARRSVAVMGNDRGAEGAVKRYEGLKGSKNGGRPANLGQNRSSGRCASIYCA